MNVLIYGSEKESQHFIQYLKTQAYTAFRRIRYFQTDDYDKFLEYLKAEEYEIIFILMDDEAGMDGVTAVCDSQPNKFILWFSNDKNFVVQSYQLGVTYFAVKPINENILHLALSRCC